MDLDASNITRTNTREATNLLIRRGSCRNAEGIGRIGAGPLTCGPSLPFLPRDPPLDSNDDDPPVSLNMCMAISGGAGIKGPSGLCMIQNAFTEDQIEIKV